MTKDNANRLFTRTSVENELANCEKLGVEAYTIFARNELKKKTGRGTTSSRTYFINHNGVSCPLKAVARMAQMKSIESDTNYYSNTYAEELDNIGFDVQYNSEIKLESAPDPIKKKAREKRYYWSLSRPGQAIFRAQVLSQHGSKCLLTGCEVEQAIEAAHLVPYAEVPDDSPANGIPLRRDIHRLFDYHMIAICPDDFTVHLNDSIKGYFSDKIYKDIKSSTRQIDGEKLVDRWKTFSQK